MKNVDHASLMDVLVEASVCSTFTGNERSM